MIMECRLWAMYLMMIEWKEQRNVNECFETLSQIFDDDWYINDLS